MMLLLLAPLLFSTGQAICCGDRPGDSRYYHDCQRRNTGQLQNRRVLIGGNWNHLETADNAWYKIKANYPTMSNACCVVACCHRTDWGGMGPNVNSVGWPHLTMWCPPGTINGGKKHYHCDTGLIQPFFPGRRLVEDPTAAMTMVSHAPSWVDVEDEFPEIARRLAETEDAGVELEEDRAPFVEHVLNDINQRRMESESGEPKQIGYVGCFADDGNRSLEFYKGDGHTALSCSNECSSYNYFGLQYHGQCFCGNNLGGEDNYPRKNDAECGSDLKGREWRNAVFTHTSFTNGFTVYDHRHFKDAAISSPYGSSHPAEQCIDGNLDTHCHTGYQKDAWLRFSFESAITVAKVMVANRKDCCQERLGRFKVMLYTYNGWQECDRNRQVDTSKQWQEVWCARPTRATKVQIQFEDDHAQDYLHIADVKVSGVEPEAQYIGCFKDDESRDLEHFKGTFSDIDACREECKSYYYFGVQNNGMCFCGNRYASDSQYYKVSDASCGSDRLGRAWTNAVFATHGGIPTLPRFQETSLTPQRRMDIMQLMRYANDALDFVVTAAICATRQLEDFIEKNPLVMRAVEAIGIVVMIALFVMALPEDLMGGIAYGAVWTVETIVDAIEGAFGGGGKVHVLAAAGGSIGAAISQGFNTAGSAIGGALDDAGSAIGGALDDAGSAIGGALSSIGIGRRRITEEALLADPDLASRMQASVQEFLDKLGDDPHTSLTTGFEALLEEYQSREDLLDAEFKTFDYIMGNANLELDDEMMGLMTEYFESFDDLLAYDAEAAATCIEEGCTMTEMKILTNQPEEAAPSGEGDGTGSAAPQVGDTHPHEAQVPAPAMDFGAETEADLPAIDDSVPAQTMAEAQDGSIVNV